MIISLWGMPASGKTTLGRLIADELKIPFTDLDSFIENSLNQSVCDIFTKSGESHFRSVERNALITFLDRKADRSMILATGGGTPCFLKNAELLIKRTLSIYIRVPVPILSNRIISAPTGRPLFTYIDTNKQLEDKLISLLKERREYYEMAHFSIDGGEKNFETVKENILKIIKTHIH